MGFTGVKVAMNVATLGLSEGFSAVCDVAEMVLDVADAVLDGSTAGVVGALLDGVVDIGKAGKFFSEGLADCMIDVIDNATDCCIEWKDWEDGFEKIHKVQQNLLKIEEGMLKEAVKEEGVELLRSVADMLCILERFNVVSSANTAFETLLTKHQQQTLIHTLAITAY